MFQSKRAWGLGANFKISSQPDSNNSWNARLRVNKIKDLLTWIVIISFLVNGSLVNRSLKFLDFKFSSSTAYVKIVGNKAKKRISKRVFPKRNGHFWPTDTHMYGYVSGGKKCSLFGIFGVLCFLVTPVLRLALLPCCWRNVCLMIELYK